MRFGRPGARRAVLGLLGGAVELDEVAHGEEFGGRVPRRKYIAQSLDEHRGVDLTCPSRSDAGVYIFYFGSISVLLFSVNKKKIQKIQSSPTPAVGITPDMRHTTYAFMRVSRKGKNTL
jgi:hypothetical protein